MAKTSPQLIAALNEILKNELTAINQYFLHSKILKHMGYMQLAAKEYEESIDEMKHAQSLTERILFIGGLPNLQDMGKLMIGETPREMLESDLNVEYKAHKDLKKAIEVAEAEKDTVTTNLLEDILTSEEDHIDWLQIQLKLMTALGEAQYLQTKI